MFEGLNFETVTKRTAGGNYKPEPNVLIDKKNGRLVLNVSAVNKLKEIYSDTNYIDVMISDNKAALAFRPTITNKGKKNLSHIGHKELVSLLDVEHGSRFKLIEFKGLLCAMINPQERE